MRIGPVPCQGCTLPVVWNGKRWRNPGQWGQVHTCPEVRATCGAWMPKARERCARMAGHGFEHRSEWAMENARETRRRERRAS